MAKSKNHRKGKKESTRPSNKNRGLNQDDETIVDIVEARDNAQDFFENNKTAILAAIGLAVLLIGGYLFYQYGIIKPKEKAVLESMYQAEYQFARDSFALALENPGGESEGFLDIIDNYSGTSASNTAKYYAGLSYLNLGRFEEAIDYLESYSPKDNITPPFKSGALGDAYAELGDLEKALSLYQKAAGYKDDASRPYFLNKVGLLANKLGNTSAAITAFEALQEEYPVTPQGISAARYLNQLTVNQ